jgi:hypothetical protein
MNRVILFFLAFFLFEISWANNYFSLDFESNVELDSKSFNKPIVEAADAFGIDCASARVGRCRLKFVIRNSPKYIQYGSHRVEFDFMNNSNFLFGSGDRFKYEFSFFIPDFFEEDVRDSIDIIWQFKQFSGYPFAVIAIKGGDIVLRYLDGQITLYKNYKKNQWIDVGLDIFWSNSNLGFINTYIKAQNDNMSDFMFITNIKNINNAGKKSGYIKFGIYKPRYELTKTLDSRVIFFDRVIIQRITN